MKHLLSLLIAAALIGGTYFFTFVYDGGGTPEQANASAPGGRAAPTGQRRGGRGSNQASTVTMASVKVEPYTDLFSALGNVQAEARVRVLSETSGRVTAVHMVPNVRIAAGSLLVSLNDELENIAVRTAQIQLRQAQETLSRYAKLASTGTLTNTSLADAQVTVDIAQAALDKASYDLEQRSIVAPIDGTPGLTDVQVGAYLNAGSELVTLTNTDSLTVEFTLPDRASELLRPGYPVRVTAPSRPGAVLEGEITAFDNEIDPQTRLIGARARFANVGRVLQPGSIVNVLVSNTNDPLPSVPVSALTWSREGATVWVANEGKVSKVPVVVRSRENDMVWLDADLEDGAQIVIEGVQKLREGSQVVTQEQLNQRRAGGGANRPAATSGQNQNRTQTPEAGS
ncbi:efflux RND transporter periplasmic adaptor subunit [Pararhizobium sp. IMCC21322]|uniref:efflux RND transporter periplasmic adaptor subunit n=1 Tax=Pararhizobium sp. IMCC21322 TaxID=3067903 RepID=UPI0027411C4B|nr:efflux RND transporter periplasmic adaptor subunit [Pararhizobium sp. IMCC21322]